MLTIETSRGQKSTRAFHLLFYTLIEISQLPSPHTAEEVEWLVWHHTLGEQRMALSSQKSPRPAFSLSLPCSLSSATFMSTGRGWLPFFSSSQWSQGPSTAYSIFCFEEWYPVPVMSKTLSQEIPQRGEIFHNSATANVRSKQSFSELWDSGHGGFKNFDQRSYSGNKFLDQ